MAIQDPDARPVILSDEFGNSADVSSPDCFSITPNDSTTFTTNTRRIYVGGAGNLTLITADGTTVTFEAVPVGMVLPVQAKAVKATGTTATNLVGMI